MPFVSRHFVSFVNCNCVSPYLVDFHRLCVCESTFCFVQIPVAVLRIDILESSVDCDFVS